MGIILFLLFAGNALDLLYLLTFSLVQPQQNNTALLPYRAELEELRNSLNEVCDSQYFHFSSSQFDRHTVLLLQLLESRLTELKKLESDLKQLSADVGADIDVCFTRFLVFSIPMFCFSFLYQMVITASTLYDLDICLVTCSPHSFQSATIILWLAFQRMVTKSLVLPPSRMTAPF